MYGNGAVIGLIAVTTHRAQLPIPQDLQAALTACTVAVAGTSTLATVVLRFAATTLLTAATTVWVFVWYCLNRGIHSIPKHKY